MRRDDEMTKPLEGGVAVVTGGGSGLGAAMAARWAAEGMRVAVLDIDAAAAEGTASGLQASGTEAISAGVDISDRAALDAVVGQVGDAFGAVNVVCANVGVQHFDKLEDLTPDTWRWVLGVNVIGTANTVNAFLPLLRTADGPRHVVLTSSLASVLPSPRQGAYIVSKFAVTGYGDVLRQELAEEGITVTTVLPSGMMTNHLGSSLAARPGDLGPGEVRDDDLQVVSSTSGDLAVELTTADDAVRRLVAAVEAGEPYHFTHGDRFDELVARHRAIEAAYEQMRQARAAGS
jgi:NAD(P)-dependent dehydrogenase (short-subunit alcohol dehydrogenase family)